MSELSRIEKDSKSFSFNTIKPIIINEIKITKRTKRAIRNEGMAPRTVVLIIIENVISRMLPTGEFNVYRGALDLSGQDLLNLYDYVISELEKIGYYSVEESRGNKLWIREQIKHVG